MIPQLNTALTFASNNFKVFPLKCNSKGEQILKSWKQEASSDINQINTWFTNTDYNLAITTGNGLVVIDVDKKHGNNGINKLKEVLNTFPATYIVRSPSGGIHLYYLVNRLIKSSVGLYEDIDIRGEGGYIVGAGSKIDDNEYKVLQNKPIAIANDAVYKFLEGVKTPSKKNMTNESGIIPIGKRNDYLFKLGCSLQSQGLFDDTIRKIVETVNIEQSETPLPSEEIEQIVHSVLRYDKQEIKDTREYVKTWESAADKKAKPIQANTDIVEGLIPIGVTILAAPAKMGKTFFAMELCNSVASGKPFLNHKTKQSNTYYLALEDPDNLQAKRLQENFKDVSSNYDIEICKAYDPNFNLEEKIINYMHFNNNLKVVVVDTFEKTRDLSRERKYTLEYNEISKYHELGIKYNIAIILVMHTIKNIRKEDPFSNISGSAGVQASADSMLLLMQLEHDDKSYILYVNGKSIVKEEIYLHKTKDCGYQVVESHLNEPYIDPDLNAIINFVISTGTYTGSAEKLGVNAKTQSVNGNHIRSLLDRNKEILKQYFISYKQLERTTNSRRFELKYYGEEPANDAI